MLLEDGFEQLGVKSLPELTEPYESKIVSLGLEIEALNGRR
ncbi:MAG: hypothetical protein ABSH28_13880 [Acidobacteriota bacterium]|jgi:hypothetical protein